MEDIHVHALDYVSVLRRRKWWLVAPIIASVVVGAALARFLPKHYKSSATIAVVAADVSQNLVGPAATIDNADRMRAVSQQLLSDAVLTRVARDQGLSAKPDERLLDRLRSSVVVRVPDPLATTAEPRRFDSFIVSYTDTSPARAQSITNSLANAFVADNSAAREQSAEQTAAFISNQLDASHARLATLEARLRQAKEAHIGQLPEQTQANLQTLSGLRQQLDATATATRGEQDRLTMIEQQLDLLAPRAVPAAAKSSQPGDGPDDAAVADAPTVDARVAALERELANARLLYTDKHPEVVRLQDELAIARTEAATEQARPVSDRVAQLRADPAYRQLAGDRDAARLRIVELQRADKDIRRQINVYQARVEAAPMVEQELASVQRDYDLEKQQYGNLSEKLQAAMIAQRVEHARSGERFSVLYPAEYPFEPSSPIPMRVMLLSVLGGIALGAALMLGREYLDRSVYDVRELRDEFDLPVLGEVDHITAA